ncbi:hypothetical protein GCM10010299_23380 [Streptomyces tanashiensis]|nr:hypothetical protein GCM10010299_23380 [Streptomyces tanashiensis]
MPTPHDGKAGWTAGCRRGPAPSLTEAVLSVVMFRGGLADVDFIADLGDAGCLPASGITSASDFGDRLDQRVIRAFGSFGEGR